VIVLICLSVKNDTLDYNDNLSHLALYTYLIYSISAYDSFSDLHLGPSSPGSLSAMS